MNKDPRNTNRKTLFVSWFNSSQIDSKRPPQLEVSEFDTHVRDRTGPLGRRGDVLPFPPMAPGAIRFVPIMAANEGGLDRAIQKAAQIRKEPSFGRAAADGASAPRLLEEVLCEAPRIVIVISTDDELTSAQLEALWQMEVGILRLTGGQAESSDPHAIEELLQGRLVMQGRVRTESERLDPTIGMALSTRLTPDQQAELFAMVYDGD